MECLARQVARELALVGLNVNLAPVLDVPRSPACPQWDRAYSSDPERAARYGVGRHPGLSVRRASSRWPNISRGWGTRWSTPTRFCPWPYPAIAQREADLLPFRQAVAAGVPMVMTAHLAVPEWEERPATLSPVALQVWLRRRLGFDGVIITDDLEMGGITTSLPAPQGAQEALAAGADLLLICNNWQAAWETARLLAVDASLAPGAGRLQPASIRCGKPCGASPPS